MTVAKRQCFARTHKETGHGTGKITYRAYLTTKKKLTHDVCRVPTTERMCFRASSSPAGLRPMSNGSKMHYFVKKRITPGFHGAQRHKKKSDLAPGSELTKMFSTGTKKKPTNGSKMHDFVTQIITSGFHGAQRHKKKSDIEPGSELTKIFSTWTKKKPTRAEDCTTPAHTATWLRGAERCWQHSTRQEYMSWVWAGRCGSGDLLWLAHRPSARNSGMLARDSNHSEACATGTETALLLRWPDPRACASMRAQTWRWQ